MKRILIATDGSQSSAEAVTFGVELAAEQEAEVILVHVAPAVDVLPGGVAFGMPASLPHALDEHDREPLERAAAVAAEHGLHATTVLLSGNPADEIVRYADKHEASLIVVGSHGYGAITGTLLGSVSRRVLHESARPVCVVRTRTVREPTPA